MEEEKRGDGGRRGRFGRKEEWGVRKGKRRGRWGDESFFEGRRIWME